MTGYEENKKEQPFEINLEMGQIRVNPHTRIFKTVQKALTGTIKLFFGKNYSIHELTVLVSSDKLRGRENEDK